MTDAEIDHLARDILTKAIKEGWIAYLHMEAHFEDCWGRSTGYDFQTGVLTDDRWGDY